MGDASVIHTPFLCVVPQRGSTDCGIACVAMLLGVSYETALIAFKKEPVRGVKTREIHAAARRLGRRLHWSRKFDLETDTGLLAVRFASTEHLVVLKEGLIVDTDATIWEQDVYLAAYSGRAMSLMTLE